MIKRCFGLETEYAFTALTPRGEAYTRSGALERFMALAKDRLKYLPGYDLNDLFLENGARFYIDCGAHPEMCTPECDNPWDIVRYMLAGERILVALADELASLEPGIGEVLVCKGNVDYSGSLSTWGSHESYLHRAKSSVLVEQIIPHLVSRVVICGAGGFNPLSAGLEFTLSPRMFFITRKVSGDSTKLRGLYHVKDEPLCSGDYQRLHIICGESLSSEIACWLRVATTAIIVALVEGGINPGEAVCIRSPLPAVRTFIQDPTCRVKIKTAGGREVSAVDIQRHYLTMAEKHLNKDFMPPWADPVCKLWREILDQLQGAPRTVAATLDWAIKHSLYMHQIQKSGLSEETLTALNQVANKLFQVSRPSVPQVGDGVPPGLGRRKSAAVAKVDPIALLAKHGLHRQDLERFLSFRNELFEIDTRFGQLGSKGIFSSLDQDGVLRHHMKGIENIPDAEVNPPDEGRARIRGKMIRQLSGKTGSYRADWYAVWDHKNKRILDLSDPFTEKEAWEEKVSPGRIRLGRRNIWLPHVISELWT